MPRRQKFEELVTARNAADGMISAATKTLEEAGEHATDDERSAIEAAITAAEDAVKTDDKDAIERQPCLDRGDQWCCSEDVCRPSRSGRGRC